MVAPAIVGQALVNVATSGTVAGESIAAFAFVATLRVGAVGVDVTVEGAHQTLVVVGASGVLIRFDRVAFLAAALVRSQRVVTFAVLADIRRRTLVDIYFSILITI